MAELKDSGARRDFGTGAVRDAAEGKGRCDLLPLYVVGVLMDSEELKLIGMFKKTKNSNCLLQAIREFSRKTDTDLSTQMIEVSKQFEDGAKKYAENNWMKGIPLHCYIDSGVRHFLKFLRGDTDEPHDRAFLWNMICAVWTFENKPELDDIEKDLKTREEDEDDLVGDKYTKPTEKEIINPYGIVEQEDVSKIYKCKKCGYLTFVVPGVIKCRGCSSSISLVFLKRVYENKLKGE